MNNPDVIFKQLEWLNKLQGITKKPILIKAIEGKTPEGNNPVFYIWINYKDISWNELKEPIYTRSILSNEILLDPDTKNWDELKKGMDLIKTFFERENIPYQFAYSGGAGIHCSVFLSPFMMDAELIELSKKYEIDLANIVRNVMVDIIFNQSGANRNALAIDSKKINFSMHKMGSMVREYGTLRSNGNYKTLITTIPDKRPNINELPLIFPDSPKLWTIPDKYISKINNEIKKAIDKAKNNNELNFAEIDLRGNELNKIPCLKTLLKNGTRTGRYYGACSIALMCRDMSIAWTKTEEHIEKFFSYCDMLESEKKLRIDNCKPMFETSDYHFSCKTIKETFGKDICNYPDCLMCKKHDEIQEVEATNTKKEEIPDSIKEKALAIMEAGTPINYLMEVYSKLHVGDIITGRALFGCIGCQSVFNSNGLHPKLSGNSGKGKTHSVKSVMHLVPQKYVMEASLSDKALYHCNIAEGTIIFNDDVEVSEELQSIIKRASTNFQTTTKHIISVKSGDNWTSKEMIIPPGIMWCLTSVNDNGSIEFLNRQFNLGVDETTQQDDMVMNFHLEKATTGERSFPINDDVLTCRVIIDDIKSKKFTVLIPYAKQIIWADMANRRNLEMFLDFIKAFAIFDYRHRAKVNETTIEANIEDFNNALSLYSKRAENQKFKLNDNEFALLRTMELNRPYYIEQLQELTKLPYLTVYRAFHGRDAKAGGGLLNKVNGLLYAPETEFIGEMEITGSGSFETERNVIKRTKPKHVYILKNEELKNLSSYGNVASLREDNK